MGDGPGQTNLRMTCKFCKSHGCFDIDALSVKPYDASSSGQFAPFVGVEGRGWEPVVWVPSTGFVASGEESKTIFNDVDLSELEWVEYDDEAKVSVEIMEIETRITKGKSSKK